MGSRESGGGWVTLAGDISGDWVSTSLIERKGRDGPKGEGRTFYLACVLFLGERAETPASLFRDDS